MKRFVGRLVGQQADDESVQGDAKLDRLVYRLNATCIISAVVLSAIFLVVGLPRAAAIAAVAAVTWIGIGALMHSGHRDAGRRLQHATGLTLLTAMAVTLGTEVNAHFALLAAAAMSPMIWTKRERIEGMIHIGAAFALWALVESGLLEQYAMAPVSSGQMADLRIVSGLSILGLLAFVTHVLIRENEIAESRLGAANEDLERQIHERKEIENELAGARDEAQRANRAKDDFLANMNREIRTPMNAIIGLARLCSHGELSSRLRDYINRIRSSSHALQGILNDILDLSNIEAREIELDEVSFDLLDVLDQLTDLVGDSASAKGIEFLVALDPDVPRMLIGDPVRLRQVLTNLTNNAVKFTAEGSVLVRIECRRLESDSVRLRFAVQDTGIGIPDDLVEGLFESFVQADGSTTRRFGGSGLGLTISRSLVELMGSEIRVESEVGKGSSFSFEVTLARSRGATIDELKPPRELEGLRILVVHDDPMASNVVCSLLSSLAFAPRSVRTEAECLEALSSARDGLRPFGLILVDWSMTGKDALGFWRRVGADPQLAEIPIVAMVSSKHAHALAGSAHETGLAGVLVKPVRARALLDVAAEVVDHDSSGLQRWMESSGFIPAVHLIAGSRILVAEDSESDQLVVREIFEHAGLPVTIVNDGAEAVREATQNHYDLVLMDVHMPGLDGLSATAALRADPRTARLPIIAMTADVLTETRSRCLEAGMNDFVAKPIPVSELLTKLVRWIDADRDRRVTTLNADVHGLATVESVSDSSLEGGLQEPPDADRHGDESPVKAASWFSRLIAFGAPMVGSSDLVKRQRLAKGLILVLVSITAIYGPIYLAAGLGEIAAITAAMASLWLVSYGLMVAGWHLSGRVLAVVVGLMGCASYGLVLGPRANYHFLLFNVVMLSPLIFTIRERRLSTVSTLVAAGLWWAVDSQMLESFATVQASDTAFALLRGNIGLVCFGFIGFSANLLARENHKGELLLRSTHTHLKEEIAQRASAEKAWVAAREAADDARLAKSEFLANMSHEIRTPMNAILGLTELCLVQDLAIGLRDQISRIRSSAQTLLRIVNDILDLSRLEAHGIELECLDFDLDLVLDQMTGSVGHAASSKGLEFLVVSEPEVPRLLRGDALRLEQVLSNLVVNAVNATDRGEIVLRLEQRESDSLQTRLRFSIKDSGTGFPFGSIREYLDAIGPDIRGGADRRRGRGLGLAICHSLVELMGGELQVESKPGVGSTFFFDVQLDQRVIEDDSMAELNSLAGLRVLVVSRHPIATEMLCGVLSSCSFSPSTAASPRKAQALLQTAAEGSPFRVVVVDWPSGGDVAMETLFREPWPTAGSAGSTGPARLLLITARDRKELLPDFDVSGRGGVLVKPVRRSALHNAILAALGEGELEAREDGLSPDLRFAIRQIRGARILVAEDNESNQLVARGILEDAGFRVDLAGNGREALEALAASDFDLVLMDLHMPVMDGYQSAKRIRQDPGHAELLILAMTADGRPETREACVAAGMNGHVAKPVDRIDLLTHLASWLEPRGGFESGHDEEPPRVEEAAIEGDGVVFPEELPGLDLEEALDRVSSNQRRLLDVLRGVERRFRGREAEIEEAWRSGEIDRTLELAHLIKGLAGNISAHALYTCSANLEDALRSGEETSLPALITKHRHALDEVMGSLAIIEATNRQGMVAAEAGDPSAKVQLPAALRFQLEELIGLLASRNLRARDLFRELGDRLDGSAMAIDLQSIADDVNGLDFGSARDKLLESMRRRGMEIREAKE